MTDTNVNDCKDTTHTYTSKCARFRATIWEEEGIFLLNQHQKFGEKVIPWLLTTSTKKSQNFDELESIALNYITDAPIAFDQE